MNNHSERGALGNFLYNTRLNLGVMTITDAVRKMYPSVQQVNIPLFNAYISALSKYERNTVPVEPQAFEFLQHWAEIFDVSKEKMSQVLVEAQKERDSQRWSRYHRSSRAVKSKSADMKPVSTLPPSEKVGAIMMEDAVLVLVKKLNLSNQYPSNIARKLVTHANEVCLVLINYCKYESK